jgi:mono/diheme cytochrome c family protein
LKVLYLLVPLLVFSYDDSFITNEEYAKMLYENPRGISCAKCHGENADGKKITFYTDKNGKKVEIFAPSIKNISFKKLKHRLKDDKYSLMPRYDYLTEEEIKTLHKYLELK